MKARPAQLNEKLPRYNHYVPRFILENFAENGQLSIFDKHTLKQFKLPPYRAMGERDFNNVVVEDGVLSFENRFTHLEDLAAPVISRIVRQKSLLGLTPMQVATLHTFVVTQLLRSKRRRLDQALVNSEIKKRWPDVEVNPLKESMADNDFEKFFSLEFIFNNLNELASALVAKHLFLMVKACEGELYISDNPMVMHNSKDYGPYGNIGLAVPHIEIYYPLSAETVLAYMCPLTMKETKEAHAAAEREVNALFSRFFLSPAGLTSAHKAEIKRLRSEIDRAKTYFAMIEVERTVPITSENLQFLNSLQVSRSFRYLACRKNDFTFATSALSEKPNWKEGIGIKIG